MRSVILDDIYELVIEMEETTELWYQQLAPHIKKVYLAPPLQPMGNDEERPLEQFKDWPKNTRHKYVQIPVMLQILELMGYQVWTNSEKTSR